METVTFLTAETIAPDLIGLHSRQPVFLNGRLLHAWLAQHPVDGDELIRSTVLALSSSFTGEYEVYPVDRKVNSIGYQGGSACIQRIKRKKTLEIDCLWTRQESDIEKSIKVSDLKCVYQSRDEVLCPVCQLSLKGESEQSISIHINMCLDSHSSCEDPEIKLQRPAIEQKDATHARDKVRGPKGQICPPSKKQRTLLNFYQVDI
jgi:hypothetical protein